MENEVKVHPLLRKVDDKVIALTLSMFILLNLGVILPVTAYLAIAS